LVGWLLWLPDCFDALQICRQGDLSSSTTIVIQHKHQLISRRDIGKAIVSKMSVRDLDKIMGRLSVNENINPYAAAKPVAKVAPSTKSV
jgi:hypothetical protein